MVNREDLKQGRTFFVKIGMEYREIIIGGGIRVEDMRVQIDGKTRYLTLTDLIEEVPADWKGKIVKLQPDKCPHCGGEIK